MQLLNSVLLLLSIPALLSTGYLALLAVASLARVRVPPATRSLCFDVIVPAHDEETGIARTVKSLLAVDWPADRFRVIVVADNCSDATAERAIGAGANVLERRDPRRRGKGYALEFAFNRGLAEGFADAFVVVDADTVVSPNLLTAFAARLERGARAAQARNAVANAESSWRTRLMALAFSLFNEVRSLGRERLGLSCGLRGNGMCISRAALERVPHEAFSIVEDLEYGIRLGEAGVRVAYACEASVLSEMVSDERASRSQRKRWETGRSELRRARGLPLLSKAVSRRDAVLLDLAVDVLVPPLSWIVLYTGAGTLAAAALSTATGWSVPSLLLWLLSSCFVSAYVLRGVHASAMGVRGLLALAWVPVYILWKLVLIAAAHTPGRWVRTSREASTGNQAEPLGTALRSGARE